MQKLIERVEEVERVNAKFEKKEKEFKFSKTGCKTQFKFNSKIRELFGDKLKFELKKHFKNGLPEKVEELIKEGEKEIDDQNHKLKIADKFGFRALDDFNKEDLARDEKEEKKIKALRKEKKEKEEKSGPIEADIGAVETAIVASGRAIGASGTASRTRGLMT